jgi:hypothetical protein
VQDAKVKVEEGRVTRSSEPSTILPHSRGAAEGPKNPRSWAEPMMVWAVMTGMLEMRVRRVRVGVVVVGKCIMKMRGGVWMGWVWWWMIMIMILNDLES